MASHTAALGLEQLHADQYYQISKPIFGARQDGVEFIQFWIRYARVRDRRGEGVGARTAWTAARCRADGTCRMPADRRFRSKDPRSSRRTSGICALAAGRATRGLR